MKKIKNKWAEIIEERPYVLLAAVICFVFVIYLPALDIYLRGDDFEWLNESYGIWQNLSVLFQRINHFFRPLIKLSYLLNYTFFKTQVPFYNLFNILIHLLNVFLLYIFILKISGKNHIAFLTCLAYGSSPIYSESILWTAGRVDSILLVFMLIVLLLFNNNNEKQPAPASQKPPLRGSLKVYCGRHIVILLLSLCALGAKETWMLLPFLVLSFLLVVKQIPLKETFQKTLPLFLLLFLYIGYFIVLPIFAQSFPPTAYAKLGIVGAIEKFGFLIFEYIGLNDAFGGATWQNILIILLLVGLGYRFIVSRNRIALWGLIWMLLSISISLPIAFAPSRYNYIPLVGFWIMVIAFLSAEIANLVKKIRSKRLPIFLTVAIAMSLLLILQVTWLQKEIDDYRIQGIPHKTIVDMYLDIRDKIPHDRPLIFVDLSKRKAEHEFVGALKGYEKVLFVRGRAIWEIVYLSQMANFVGDPFKLKMEPVPEKDLGSVFFMDYTLLVFTDKGFFISDIYKSRIQEFFQENGELPYKVEALHFVPVKKKNL